MRLLTSTEAFMLVNLEYSTLHFTPNSVPPPLLPELLFLIFSEVVKDPSFSKAAGTLGHCFQVNHRWNSQNASSRLWKKFLSTHFPSSNPIFQNPPFDWKAFAKKVYLNCMNRNQLSPYSNNSLVHDKNFPDYVKIKFLTLEGNRALFLSDQGAIYAFDPDEHCLTILTRLPFSIASVSSIFTDIVPLRNGRFALLCVETYPNLIKIIDKNKNWSVIKQIKISSIFKIIKSTNSNRFISQDLLKRGFLLNSKAEVINSFDEFMIPKNQDSCELAFCITSDKQRCYVIDFNQKTKKNDNSIPFNINTITRSNKKLRNHNSTRFKFKIVATIDCLITRIYDSTITPQGQLALTLKKKLIIVDLKNGKTSETINASISKRSILEFDERDQLTLYSITEKQPKLSIFDPELKELKEIKHPSAMGPFPYFYIDGDEKIYHHSLMQKIDVGVLFSAHPSHPHIDPVPWMTNKQWIINYSGSTIKHRAELYRLRKELESEEEMCKTSMSADQTSRFLSLPDDLKNKVYNCLFSITYREESLEWKGMGKESFLSLGGQECQNWHRTWAITEALELE